MNPSSSDGYVSPFAQPTINITVENISSVLTVVFFLVFTIWVIYTVIAAYHWFRYGHKSWLAVPTLGLHVFVSGLIIIYMASGLA